MAWAIPASSIQLAWVVTQDLATGLADVAASLPETLTLSALLPIGVLSLFGPETSIDGDDQGVLHFAASMRQRTGAPLQPPPAGRCRN
jgi:hypothetical protein